MRLDHLLSKEQIGDIVSLPLFFIFAGLEWAEVQAHKL